MIERGKSYMADDFGAGWSDELGGGWLVLRLSTGNAVDAYDTVEDLLRDFPEFENADSCDP